MEKNNSSGTRALIEYFLDKHSMPAEKFGLGPCLQISDFDLFAAQDDFKGSLVLKRDPKVYNGCKSICRRLIKDIEKNNPELNPRLMMYSNRGIHYWVEVCDPRTKVWFQIDCTPWFSKIDPGHIGHETDDPFDPEVLILTKMFARPFSVAKKDLYFIDTYLHGFMPKVFYNVLAEKSEKMPDYRFIMLVVKEKFFQAEPQASLYFFLDIPDAKKLETEINNAKSIEELIDKQIVEIGFGKPVGRHFELMHEFPSLKSVQEYVKETENEELFPEIYKNLPTIFLLLKKVRHKLKIYKDKKLINVQTCEKEEGGGRKPYD